MEYGLQLYSVRDAMEKDVKSTLKEVSAIGYKFVELAGFYGVDAITMKSWLDEYGLTVCSAHIGIGELTDKYNETIENLRVLGCNNVVIPWTQTNETEEILETVRQINEIQSKLEKDRFTLSYHNHDHEFTLHKDGILPFACLEHLTHVNFEIDSFWVFFSKLDPGKTLDRLGQRITFLHVKDGLKTREGMTLGEGEAPVKEIVAKGIEMGLPLIVESEKLEPDGLTEARKCFDYLKSLKF